MMIMRIPPPIATMFKIKERNRNKGDQKPYANYSQGDKRPFNQDLP